MVGRRHQRGAPRGGGGGGVAPGATTPTPSRSSACSGTLATAAARRCTRSGSTAPTWGCSCAPSLSASSRATATKAGSLRGAASGSHAHAPRANSQRRVCGGRDTRNTLAPSPAESFPPRRSRSTRRRRCCPPCPSPHGRRSTQRGHRSHQPCCVAPALWTPPCAASSFPRACTRAGAPPRRTWRPLERCFCTKWRAPPPLRRKGRSSSSRTETPQEVQRQAAPTTWRSLPATCCLCRGAAFFACPCAGQRAAWG